jgi:uncharacterized protein with HEPN domain
MSPRLWHHRITDILEAIARIKHYTKGMDFENFQRDSKTLDAVIRNFIVIGGPGRNMPEEITEQFPTIPRRLMGDMRNFAVHEYSGVELRTVWEAIHQDLSPLITLLREILEKEPRSQK